MEFTQRKVTVVQSMLMLLFLSMFLVPVSWESFDLFNIYLFYFPITIPIVAIGLLGLFIGLVLNSKNEASFKSTYFIGSIFIPLNFFLIILLNGFEYGFPALEEYTYWVFFALSMIQVALYVFYGFFFKDPLDWTSHKVEPKSVDVKFIPQFVIAAIGFVFLILNIFFYYNDVTSTSDFLVMSFGWPQSMLYLWLVLPWLFFALMINQRLLVGIKDRLYFFVVSSIAFYFVLILDNFQSISWFIDDFYAVENLGDTLFLIFTVATFVVFPLVVIIFSFWFFKKNEQQLVPYVNRGYVDKNPSVNNGESDDDLSYESSDPKIESWDVPSDSEWNEDSPISSSKSGSSMQVDRHRVFMILVHIALFLLFIIALNSKVFVLDLGALNSRFSFLELRDLLQALEAFTDSNDASLLIGFYLTLIIGVQLVSAIGHLYLKPKFNNNAFLAIVVAQAIHFIILVIVTIRFTVLVNDLNEIVSIFGGRINFGFGFGFFLHILFLGLGIFIYAGGNRYLPQLSTALSSLDFGTTGSVSNGSHSSRPRPSGPPRSSRPSLERFTDEDQRPERPPRPPRPPRPSRPDVDTFNDEGQNPPERPSRPPRSPRPEPRSQTTPMANTTESSDLEKNLASLKRLLDEGLITEAEYQEKKKQQLDKYL
jgi:hypothetical protein